MSMPDVDTKVRNELVRLIKYGSEIVRSSTEDYSFESKINAFHKDVKSFQLSTENLLINRFGRGSFYYKHFEKSNVRSRSSVSEYKLLISVQVGILESVLIALDHGLCDDLFYQREIVVLSDMLDQAFAFIEYDLSLAAGIYGRIVLETAIKEFAKSKLPESELNGKFDQLIINLRKNGYIQKPFENSLRANYEIGSWAAHGNEQFLKRKKEENMEFLLFIRDRVLTLT